MSDTTERVRIEGIDATLIGHALTFNTETEDGMGVAAQYVILTPEQAQQVKSFFLNHHGERRERRNQHEDDYPSWLKKTPAQAATAAESCRYVATHLPAGDHRKSRAMEAAGIMEDVSESLHEEKTEQMDNDAD